MTDEQQKAGQEKAMLYQILQAQMEELTKQGGMIESRMIELEAAENSLKEMNGAKVDSDILIPLGAGCYGYGKLTNKDKFMVEIGTGLVKEQSLKGAIAVIENKRKEVDDAAKKLNMEMERMRSAMDRIGLELQEMASKEQQGKGDGITVD
jgi:prefoldin alpha subunit